MGLRSSDYKVIHWLEKNLVGEMPFDSTASHLSTVPRGVWEERREAEAGISSYLSESPSTPEFNR